MDNNVSPPSQKEIDRLFGRVRKFGDDGCWIWQGACDKAGYGAIKYRGRKINTHRLSLMANLGVSELPKGMDVMHTCNCRQCVNPSHLKLGTRSENMKHAHEDGRGYDFIAHGEEHACSKLSESDVREIRRLREKGLSLESIARRYGVAKRTVFGVVSGSSWKHIQ